MNKEYFLKLGIDEEEFNILCSLSSWATCSFQKGQSKETHSAMNDTNVDASLDYEKKESESCTDILHSCSTAFQSRCFYALLCFNCLFLVSFLSCLIVIFQFN